MQRVLLSLPGVLLLILTAGAETAVTDWISETFRLGENHREHFLARHEVYDFNVTEQGWYQKIMRGPDRSVAGSLEQAQRLPSCPFLSTNASNVKAAEIIRDSAWCVTERSPVSGFALCPQRSS